MTENVTTGNGDDAITGDGGANVISTSGAPTSCTVALGTTRSWAEPAAMSSTAMATSTSSPTTPRVAR